MRWLPLLLLAAPVTSLAETPSPDRLYLTGIQSMLAKQYGPAISAYQELLKTPQIPEWLRLAAEADLAYASFASKDKVKGFEHLAKAIELGFNDDEMIRTDPVYAPFRRDPELVALYSKIRVSDADRAELAWLKREAEQVATDTNALLYESESRIDLFFTDVVQSALPNRQFQSLWVGVSRNIVALLQDLSRRAVVDADYRRILETGTRIYADVDAIAIAQAEATKRTDQRRQQVRARAFSVSPDATIDLRAPPPLK
ncbi:MAG: hypothetical protein HY791_22780 [Deltaproteobacteria bacterium]|nr:hypothetical protein [Deltaproteobacteria bacterium]